MVELGRVDIITEVSLLTSQMTMPRRGHLDAALHVIAHLKSRTNTQMIFDPTYADINVSEFEQHDWPNYMAMPRGKDIDLHLMVDSDHAGDKLLRQSCTGYFIFLNSALIA